MNLLKTLNRVVETLSKTGAVAGGVGIVILMLLATAGAIGRKLGHPVPCSLEACETIMFASVFLGMAYVALQGGHINVTLFHTAFIVPGSGTHWMRWFCCCPQRYLEC